MCTLDSADGRGVDKPLNFDELYEFWKRVAKENPWPTTTFGGYTAKGARIERQMTQEELDRACRAAADELGWIVPEPVWRKEVPF